MFVWPMMKPKVYVPSDNDWDPLFVFLWNDRLNNGCNETIDWLLDKVTNRHGHGNNTRKLNRQRGNHSKPHLVQRGNGGIDL